MLYLAHFSFVEYGENRGFGNFSFLIDADDPDSAVEIIRERLPAYRREAELFKGVTHIFIDDILEVGELPQEGILTNYVHYAGEQPSLVSYSLPEQDIEGVEVWNLDQEDSGNGASGIEPFLMLE